MMLLGLGAVFTCLLYECVGLLSMLCVCVCGNYSNLNAGNAGETVSLLINDWSRWPRVGGSYERTSKPVRWSAQHNTPGPSNKQDKPSRRHKPQTSGLFMCQCLCMYGLPESPLTDTYSVLSDLMCKGGVSTGDPSSYGSFELQATRK